MAVFKVTSKVKSPSRKRVRDAFGITPGSKVEFDVAGGGARLKVFKKHASSRVEGRGGHSRVSGRRISVEMTAGWR